MKRTYIKRKKHNVQRLACRIYIFIYQRQTITETDICEHETSII